MELVTAVLGDHGQRPKDDYGMCNILFLFMLLFCLYAVFVLLLVWRGYFTYLTMTSFFIPWILPFLVVFVYNISFECIFIWFYFVLYAAVVTAVTELGHGKPKFYSTPEVIAFCRIWRLQTNHIWLFSTRWPSDNFMLRKFLCQSIWLPF
jgi:hypothetical protein